MKYVLALVAVLASAISTAEVSGVTEFDGFAWGSSASEIRERRSGSRPRQWEHGIISYNVDGSESIGKYPISRVTYYFRNVNYLHLANGVYTLQSPSEQLVADLTDILVERYGEFTDTVKSYPKKNFSSGKVIAEDLITSRTFQLPDRSTVALGIRRYDRDFKDFQTMKKKGIYDVFVRYAEPVEEKEPIPQVSKTKDF